MGILAFIKKTTLKSICDAVREKIGESKTYLPSELPDKIRSIKTGSDVSGVTASPTDVRKNKKYVDNQGVLRQGTMPELPSRSYTPGTSSYTISSGQYITGSQTILGDSDLIPRNIRSGVNIFGVNGNYVGNPYKAIEANNFTVIGGSSNGILIEFPTTFKKVKAFLLSTKYKGFDSPGYISSIAIFFDENYSDHSISSGNFCMSVPDQSISYFWKESNPVPYVSDLTITNNAISFFKGTSIGYRDAGFGPVFSSEYQCIAIVSD